jgi:hypothetical protein
MIHEFCWDLFEHITSNFLGVSFLFRRNLLGRRGRRGGLLPRRNAMEGAVGIISLGIDYRNLISLRFSSFCLWFSL